MNRAPAVVLQGQRRRPKTPSARPTGHCRGPDLLQLLLVRSGPFHDVRDEKLLLSPRLKDQWNPERILGQTVIGARKQNLSDLSRASLVLWWTTFLSLSRSLIFHGQSSETQSTRPGHMVQKFSFWAENEALWSQWRPHVVGVCTALSSVHICVCFQRGSKRTAAVDGPSASSELSVASQS